jgi:hypothetical protein
LLVFRGTGKRISAAEKAQYHPRIHVDFQPKAWVDGPVLWKWSDEYVCCHGCNLIKSAHICRAVVIIN